MKLYTEEQVKRTMKLARETYASEGQLLLSFEPIELPSDEEIDRMWPLYYTEFGNGLNEGAKQMRDKIKGGNK